uniref:hypothetical protein n=1 Tax=Prevotella pallens TaxID=60133 RepID=UPI0023F984AC
NKIKREEREDLHTFSDTTYYTLCIKQTKFRLAYNIIHILLLNPNVVMANSYLLENRTRKKVVP